VSRQLEQAWVEVEVRVEVDELTLRVQNSTAPGPKENGHEGIGLANVRRRLDLLYGGSYRLDISSEGDRFSVTLILNLNHQPESEVA
jgi:LytS/YehU family sensor histidine kinase